MPSEKWFSNRGQIVQTTAAVLALILSGIKARPDMHNGSYFSVGDAIFYLICLIMAIFVAAPIWVYSHNRYRSRIPTSSTTPEGFDAVLYQYRQLPTDQKIALTIISKGKNLTFPEALERLSSFQFSPQQTLNRLLNETKMVDFSIVSNTVSVIPSVADSLRAVTEREPPL